MYTWRAGIVVLDAWPCGSRRVSQGWFLGFWFRRREKQTHKIWRGYRRKMVTLNSDAYWTSNWRLNAQLNIVVWSVEHWFWLHIYVYSLETLAYRCHGDYIIWVRKSVSVRKEELRRECSKAWEPQYLEDDWRKGESRGARKLGGKPTKGSWKPTEEKILWHGGEVLEI